MDSKTPCRLGLVGCGRWGKFILRDLLQQGCQVSVVVRDIASQNAASEAGAMNVVQDIADLPADIEGFVVATPTSTHFDVIERLAVHGKPIYCEKPLTNNLQAAESIVKQWGHLVFVMDKWRYHPAIEQIRLWVESEKFGRLQSIRTRRLQWGSPHKDAESPWILMPHDLSIARHILGELPELKWCAGQVVDGNVCSLTALLSGEVDCLLETSIVSPVSHRRVEIYGEKGAVILDDSDYGILLWNHTEDFSFGRAPEKFRLSDALPLAAELTAFINYVHLEGDPPLTGAADGLESVALISRMIDTVKCHSLP